MNAEKLDACKGELSDDALAALSVQLKKRGRIPYSFGQSTVQATRRGGDRTVSFARVFAMANILGLRADEILLEEPEPVDIADDPVPGLEKQARTSSGHVGSNKEGVADAASKSTRVKRLPGYVEEIRLWLLYTAMQTAAVVGLYVLLLLSIGYEPLRIGLPMLHAGSSIVLGYATRSRSRYPMPTSLRVTFSMGSGLLVGMTCTIAVALFATDQLDHFRQITTWFSGFAMVTSGTVSFLAGYWLAVSEAFYKRDTRRTWGAMSRLVIAASLMLASVILAHA